MRIHNVVFHVLSAIYATKGNIQLFFLEIRLTNFTALKNEFCPALPKIMDLEFICENWSNDTMAFVPSTSTSIKEEGVCVARCNTRRNDPIETFLCYPADSGSEPTWHMVITGQGSETDTVTDSEIQQWAAKKC